MRVGLGYDIHQLGVGRKLVLGGVDIPSGAGLLGHSDADVLLHAIMDALLGAAALGDIGQHFPPTDEQFRDIASVQLLARVRDMLRAAGYLVVNVDTVVVAEEPRLAPYVMQIRQRIAAVLGVDAGAIGVKATTNEGVGPEGRGEAISAHAVAAIEATG